MPKEIFGADFQFLRRDEVLSFEEIARIAGIAVDMGVEKIRLTGGEPLVRRGIDGLVAMLAQIPGLRDLTLTTNGSLLEAQSAALARAGLRRITVSLDSLDDAVFKSMNDVDFPVAKVLAGIEAATAAGLAPIKVNMVVKRGVNERSILDMAGHFRGTGHILRFIEFMDVGNTNGWRMDDVVPAEEILKIISQQWPVEAIAANYSGEVASRWRYSDGAGEIGIIASVSQPFCGACTRARLSAEGRLYTCLFSSTGHDLRALLRSGKPDSEIADAISRIWRVRDDRYSELRSAETVHVPKVEMSHIGG
jgi:cyclic pyranopterin phosphate synthase